MHQNVDPRAGMVQEECRWRGNDREWLVADKALTACSADGLGVVSKYDWVHILIFDLRRGYDKFGRHGVLPEPRRFIASGVWHETEENGSCKHVMSETFFNEPAGMDKSSGFVSRWQRQYAIVYVYIYNRRLVITFEQ
jgi:hypothetical protein